MKKNLKENFIWNSIGSLIYLFLQWILTVVVVRVLNYEAAGSYSLATSAATMFHALALYSIRNFQVSDTKDEYTSGVYIFHRFLTCGIAFIFCILSNTVQGYTAEQLLCIVFYMLFKLSESFVDVYHGIDQKALRMDIIGKSYIIRGCLTAIVFCLVLVITKDLNLAILLMGAASILVIIVYDRPSANRFQSTNPEINWGQILSLFKKGFWLFLCTFLSNMIFVIPKYMLESYWGKEFLGIYSSIATPTIVVQVAATLVFNPLITVFAYYHDNKDWGKFWKALIKTCGAIIGIGAISVIGAALFGEWGLRLLFGESIVPYTYLLVPIVITTLLTAVARLFYMILTVIRDYRGLAISGFIAVVACVAIGPLLVGRYDMSGTNYSMMIPLIIQIIFMILYSMHRNGTKNTPKAGKIK